MRRSCFIAATVVLSLTSMLAPPAAQADVAASGPGGFVLKIENTLAGDPEKVFDQVIRVGDWWNGAHTYSGSAGNLRIDNQPGGCFCEQLAGGGFVRHGVVEFSSRGKVLRIAGALGPLQGMGAYGLMAFTFQKADAGTKLVVTYTVSGYAPGKGYEELAGVVNEVLTEQFTRLKQAVDTGKPLPPKPETKG